MPDISQERIDEIIDVPAQAIMYEVEYLGRELLHTQGILKLRNTQTRRLTDSLNRERQAHVATRKYYTDRTLFLIIVTAGTIFSLASIVLTYQV